MDLLIDGLESRKSGEKFHDFVLDDAIHINSRYLTNNKIVMDKLYNFNKSLCVRSEMGTGKT